MNLAAVQADICQRIQQELHQATANQDWNTVAAIAPTLKELSETLKNFQSCMGQTQLPSFSDARGLANASLSQWSGRTEIEKSLFQRMQPERAVPKVPSSYAWSDGFEGVTVGQKDDDAWG